MDRETITRLFRKFVVVLYWIVLPICLLAFVGSFSTFGPNGGGYCPAWAMAGASALLTAIVGWRLWLNRRALGHAGKAPSVPRLLSNFAPLGALALLGSAVGLLGLAWVGLGLWMLFRPETPDSILFTRIGAFDGALTTAMLLVIGALVAAMGAALAWPFWRLLTRKPMTQSFPDASPDLDKDHD